MYTVEEFLIKKKNNIDKEDNFSILIKDKDRNNLGRLSCVDKASIQDSLVIKELTAWRQCYMKYFMTQFQSNFDRTKEWLENIVLPDLSRILFLIRLLDGEAVGSFGVCNIYRKSAELDNLMRGKKGGDPKLIYFSEIALLDWMFSRLDCCVAKLRVFSNNYLAVKLHSSVGFSVTQANPLYYYEDNGIVRYIENYHSGKSALFSCLHMEISKDFFYNQHPWVKKK